MNDGGKERFLKNWENGSSKKNVKGYVINDSPPSISIIIPTLNSERILELCIGSIFQQDYPKKLLEIIVADGGSTDNTLFIVDDFVKKDHFSIQVFENFLKTGEAGKAVGFKNSGNEIIAFIDSDNVLPDDQWLKKMVAPFSSKDIIATEPLTYIYRKKDGYINRYCALMGMNDPICLFIGNYDRQCVLTGKWTGVPVQIRENDNYFHVILKNGLLPTMGANGFFIRRTALASLKIEQYLFDVDILKMFLKQNREAHVAKVKTGIIHLYCPNMGLFYRKQKRRILDYYKFNVQERLSGLNYAEKRGIVLFCLSCLTIVPLLLQTLYGFIRRPDSCWFFHPIACLLTFVMYSYVSIKNILGMDTELSRKNWSQ